MADSPATAMVATPPPAHAGLVASPDRDRMGSGGARNTLPGPTRVTPENPDTFTGLLARFDTYLAQLQKAENALEEHADKLVTPDPAGPAVNPTAAQVIGDDKSNSVIRKLQARVDRFAVLVNALATHQERADRAF